MSLRTSIEVTVQLGQDNQLVDLLFDRDLSQLLDTLDRGLAHTITLAAGESNFSIPFGDIAEARIVYIESDGDITVSPGGGTATAAQVDGVAGTYPTGFDGTSDTLDIKIDGTTLNVAFQDADETLAQVINRINSTAALAGFTGPGGIPATVARNNGSNQLRLVSPTTGTTSTVEILSSTPAGVLTILGLSAGVTTGANAQPGQTPLQIYRPKHADNTDDVASFMLATLRCSALTISNLDTVNSVRVRVALAGDVLAEPPGC